MKILESIVLPTYADKASRWKVNVDLSKARYTLYVSYNARQEAWIMSVFDVNGNLLLGGIRLVPGIFFLEKYRASVPQLPPGDLWLVDIDGKTGTAEVTRQNLSTRYALTYTVFGED
jgi:hypothetical protein